jgi:hypothetical protein
VCGEHLVVVAAGVRAQYPELRAGNLVPLGQTREPFLPVRLV